ncbi:MAG: hypothetical protein QW407_06230 [Thermofilaceae archaeon]
MGMGLEEDVKRVAREAAVLLLGGKPIRIDVQGSVIKVDSWRMEVPRIKVRVGKVAGALPFLARIVLVPPVPERRSVLTVDTVERIMEELLYTVLECQWKSIDTERMIQLLGELYGPPRRPDYGATVIDSGGTSRWAALELYYACWMG